MIPKIIHYCWFGGSELPAKAKKCIASWKKYCPDYEIIEWNEENFDVNLNPYTRMCYEQKQYAFLTDYVRLLVIYQQGGIYFDTDVEVVRSFDDMLVNKAFFGFENEDYVNTGVGFGAEANNEIIHQMIEEYEPLLDGTHGVITCPKLNTDALLKVGLKRDGRKQEFACATVYPMDFFNPYDDLTGRLKKTKNTYSIHWYSKSWMNRKLIIRNKLTRILHRVVGVDFWKGIKT